MRWQEWRQGSAHPERDEELLLLLLLDDELDEDEELLDEEDVPSMLSALRSSSSASRARSALFSRSCTGTEMLSLQAGRFTCCPIPQHISTVQRFQIGAVQIARSMKPLWSLSLVSRIEGTGLDRNDIISEPWFTWASQRADILGRPRRVCAQMAGKVAVEQ